jgi:hypothetical protein
MLPPATPARANARQRHRGADPGQHRCSRFLAAGFRPAQPPLLPLALLFMVLIAIMCTAIGAAIGSVLQDIQGFQLTISFLVLPLFFFRARCSRYRICRGRFGSKISSSRSARSSAASQ